MASINTCRCARPDAHVSQHTGAKSDARRALEGRVALQHRAAVAASQQFDVRPQYLHDVTVAFHEEAPSRPAADGLEADGARARESVEDVGTLAVAAEQPEERFLDAIGDRPGHARVARGVEKTSTELAGDDAHVLGQA
jgi:hypothetical protein